MANWKIINGGIGGVEIKRNPFFTKIVGGIIILIPAGFIQGREEGILKKGGGFFSIFGKKKNPMGIIVFSLFFKIFPPGKKGFLIIPNLDLTLFAVLACLIMLKTGNIWVIGGLHAAWNCFQGNVFAFSVSGTDAGQAFIQIGITGPEWLSGGKFGVEGSVISLLVQGIMICWLVYDLYFKPKTSSL
ncbi:Predicted metal-dependent membrane protease [Streptococcus suis 05ZYH33]|nr:Predicted metal-dependent membrane protease [Streptococcus suis 05ZYH33]